MIIVEAAQFIDNSGLGTFDTTGDAGDIFLEQMPPTPDEAICLYSTGGAPADAKTTVARPGAQLIIRGSDLEATMTKAEALHAFFNDSSITEFVSGGTRVMLCQCRTSEPIFLEADENGRYQYTFEIAMITGGE